jgi:hypothetical protein
MRITVDPQRFEQVAREEKELLDSIAERAKQAGAIHHQFFAGDGEVLVVDEWPDEASFLGFFEAAGPDIGSLMSKAGVSNEPQPLFWRALDTSDKF